MKLLICCWCDVGCDEAGMKLELVDVIEVHFPIYVSLYVSISHAMDS